MRIAARAFAFAMVVAMAGSVRAVRADFCDITRPEFFPIIPWNYYSPRTPWIKGSNGLESVAECGFNFAPFAFPHELERCHKLGLGAIVAPADGSTLKDLRGRDFVGDEVERRVRQMIDDAGGNPAVKGFFIMDEPSARDFPLLARAVATVKRYAPGKFAYINLYPDYATIGASDQSQLGTGTYAEYLERFVREVKPQFLSYDNYRVQISRDLKDARRAESYYRNLLEIRRVGLEHGLPFLTIVTANQIRPYTTIPSPANLAFQAYTTLAAGYRGVGWFTYYQGGYRYAPIDGNGRRTLTWEYLRAINRQVATLAPVMSRLRSTGVYFTEPQPAGALPGLPGGQVMALTGSEPMMVGEFSGPAGECYAMVVNLSLEHSAKFVLQSRVSPAAIRVLSAMDASLSRFDSDAGLWLVAGQGVLLKFEDP